MKTIKSFLLWVLVFINSFMLETLPVLAFVVALNVNAQPTDAKVCGFVPRTAGGDIKRDLSQLRGFQNLHPCPSTGLKSGSCPGFAIDHIVPLSCGGCDTPTNMQWLPLAAKSCKENKCKDRFERNIQYVDEQMPGLIKVSCTPKLLTADYFNQ